MSDSDPFFDDYRPSLTPDYSQDWGWAPPSFGEGRLDAESPDVFIPISTSLDFADLVSGESISTSLDFVNLVSGESSNQELASGPSLQQDRRSPESDLRRTNRLRPRNRRFRVSPSDDGGDVSPSPIADQLARDIVSSWKDLENRRKYDAKRLPGDDSYDEFKDKLKVASNFECNICFDIAKEPVVTSCGHLFCWSCLYRWLHVHSDFRECPVCKGVVDDANITPIYGRAGDESCVGKEKEGLEIPPRPGGNRHESFRQQLRALSRRLVAEDVVGSDTTTTPSTEGRADGEEAIPESVVASVLQSRSLGLLYRDSYDFLNDLAIQSSERIASIAADRDISVSRFAGGNISVERAPGIDLNDTSEEPNNVGSSRVHIRRRSGSLDLDEELRYADRRRRS